MTEKFNESQVQKFRAAYIACMLWSSSDGDGSQGNLDENYDESDIAEEAMESIVEETNDFITAQADLLLEAINRPGYDIERAGHDFWLTRNGHGAGFWDRTELDEGDLGDRLAEAAKVYSGQDPYVGDDGKVYI